MNEYNNFQEVIDVLNENKLPYLILRNYDNLLEKEMYMNGHGDVDMLVADSKVVKEVLNAQEYPSHGDDGTHYYIMVDGERVSLDLRHIGDGYYCTSWQKDMLNRRVKRKGFYVMSQEDYFYSLIYHAILQKPKFSNEYKDRLTKMAIELNFSLTEKITSYDFIHLLENYMRKNSYTYTFPTDTYVPLKKKMIDKKLLANSPKLAWEHWKFDTKCSIIGFGVKCKHLLTNGKFE